MRHLSLFAVLALGCAGSARSVDAPTKHGADNGEIDITRAALPYKFLRARGGTEISADELWRELGAARAVCIGESHKNPHHHWAQLHLFDKLSQRNREGGVETALGMEMFQRPFQGVLDDFAAGRIDEPALLARSGYQQRWGYDWGFYGPIVRLAVERRSPILALNTERELTKRVSRAGLAKLTAAERAKLPELDLENPEHRAWWNQIMGDMGGAHGHGSHGEGDEKPEAEEAEAEEAEDQGESPGDRIYAAQVLWDETMAEGAARWLGQGGKRQIIILAGNGHCHDSAIVGRLKRRGVTPAVSIQPILETGEGEIAEALAKPMNDFLMVMTIPK